MFTGTYLYSLAILGMQLQVQMTHASLTEPRRTTVRVTLGMETNS